MKLLQYYYNLKKNRQHFIEYLNNDILKRRNKQKGFSKQRIDKELTYNTLPPF